MISVKEAKMLVDANCALLPPVVVGLKDAAGLSLAADLVASLDLPPFNQSSMDGYAIAFADYEPGKWFKAGGKVAAGSRLNTTLEKGEAIRIFTGAPLPGQADTVIMQEDAIADDQGIRLNARGITKGANVRLQGAEIKQGSLAIAKGSSLTPAAIAYAAGLGIASIPVISKVKIALLISGNELCIPGEPLAAGQVYESTSFGLEAALKQLPAEVQATQWVKDDPDELTAAIEQALLTNDIVLVTGGVSVGDFDYTLAAAGRAGVEKIFHKVRQKPGKPLYFGRKEHKLVFGLPGNPSSVLTCFYLYVAPAIHMLCGTKVTGSQQTARFTGHYQKNKGFTHFLKGIVENNEVRLSGAQESYRLSGYARSNCLVVADEEIEELKTGSEVVILPLT